MDADAGALDIAAAVRSRRTSAVDVARAALARIAAGDREVNAFTTLTEERALAEAAAVDALIAQGRDPGPLAGVPYAAKNLFDVRGLPTVAGSTIDRDRSPAADDATLVRKLARAGAVLVGVTNMDEYAMGYSTENAHYGPTRNPHDLGRMAGGSSGGSTAAVAAGFVPVGLGTDTGGSISVPASLCGVYGLKPTYGRLGRTGARLLASSFDHVGPFARSVRDLAAVYDALQGHDGDDPVSARREVEPVSVELARGTTGLRIAAWLGDEETPATAEAIEAVERIAAALDARTRVTVPEAARARAAASIMTGCEASAFHRASLRTRADEFDPLTRDRLLAASLIPNAWYLQATRLRRWLRDRMLDLFRSVDVVLTPATPFSAPVIGQASLRIGEREVMTRRHLGAFTQPVSFLGFPVLCLPAKPPGRMPLGVCVIAAPWREAHVFRVAAAAEAAGVAHAGIAAIPTPA